MDEDDIIAESIYLLATRSTDQELLLSLVFAGEYCIIVISFGSRGLHILCFLAIFI